MDIKPLKLVDGMILRHGQIIKGTTNMSMRHGHPRQDRRGVGRSPVRDHADTPSVGTEKPKRVKTIIDPRNGAPFGEGDYENAPGANGPPTTGA
jgi:hypothetical protein